MSSEKLNLDIPGSISEFESAIHEFLLKRVIYKIILRGKGLEFDSYRDFSPDDDAGSIDWKASSRANKLLARQYIEERDSKIMFVVDVGDNMVLGSQERLKCEYAGEMVAALAHLILTSNDKIGFILFNDKIVKSVMPKSGMKHLSLFADFLSDVRMYGGNSKIEGVLDFLINYLDDSIKCIIFVSDFLKLHRGLFKKLELISFKFETMAFMVRDPLDTSLPDINGEVIIEDPVTHEQMIINPKVAKRTYERNALEQEKTVEEMFKDCDIDFLRLNTGVRFVEPLANFLKERVEKRKHLVAK